MSSMFSSPKMPEAPPPPPKPPALDESKQNEAAEAERAERMKRQQVGRASTILTGGQGTSETASVSRKVLLGE